MTTRPSLAASLACVALLAACSGETEPPPAETGSYSDVEGAQEESEAQYRLVLGDTGDGTVAVLNLLDESVQEVTTVDGLRDVVSDGRFAYLGGSDGVHVVDSGAWTWDHGDHNHYYRADVRDLGATGIDGAAAGAFNQPTVVLDDAGTATALDREALEAGEVEATEIPYASGVALAVGEEVLAGSPDADALQVRTPAGERVFDVAEPCTAPAGTARTRAGIVVGCAEGALVLDPDEDWSAELVAYPVGTAEDERARDFQHRPGSTVLGALRGDAGAWALDVRARTWTAIDAPDAVAVSAAGEDLPVLVLAEDGTLRSHAADTGEELTSVALLDEGLDADTPPSIAIDTARAYVNDAAAGVVHEIDYNDDLRIARTLDVDLSPSLMVETGW